MSETYSSNADAPIDTAGTGNGELRDRAEEVWNTTKDRAETAFHDGEDYVRENPIPTLLGALAVGFALGLLCGHGHERPSWRETYVDEPIERSHGAVLAAALAIAATARRLFKCSSDAACDTADSLQKRAKPLAKAVKRAGKKLHVA